MKLAILTQYYVPEMGAPQNRLLEMSRGLKKFGCEIFVITAMPNYPGGKIFPEYKGKLAISEKIEDIAIQRYWLFASNSTHSLPRIISMLSFSLTSLLSVSHLRKIKPDYLIVESPPLPLAFSGWLLSRICGVKLILNISDLWPLSAKELKIISDGIFYKSLEALEKFLYKRSFACLGQSDEIVNHLVEKAALKTFLFRNSVDVRRFDQAKKKGQSHKLKIVYAGLLGMAQGIHQYCKNLDFAKASMEFHIFGEGPERRLLEDYCRKHPVKNIYLHQPVERDKIPHILSGFDIYFIPLKRPIFGAVPSKIYEAMAAGLPIIYAGDGEGAEIIKKHQLGWCCHPSDFKSIQELLIAISKLDRVELNLLRANCFKATKEFDRGIQIEKLNEFLMENLESPEGNQSMDK